MSDWVSYVVTQPSSVIDLTTLAIVKDELKLVTTDTSNDAWLARAITQASGIISIYCNRPFWPQWYSETQQIQQDPYPYQTPGGVQPLQLSLWPVIQLNSVNQVYPIAVNQTLVLNTDYSVDSYNGCLQRLNPFTGVAIIWEALPTVIDYIGGFGAMANETPTIPANPGPYTISPVQAALLSFVYSITYKSTGIAFTQIASGTPAAGQYTLTFVSGSAVLTFAAADQGQQIALSYAYANIPATLVQAVLRMVTLRFFERGRDPMLMSLEQPNLGAQRWWIATSGKGDNGAVPPEVAGLLAPYRVPVVA